MSVFRVRLTQGDSRTGDGNLDTTSQATGSITGATNVSPIVITATGHGLASGRSITVKGVTGNTAANGTWIITKIDTNTFSLNGSTGNGSYVSGGTWVANSVQRTMYCMGPNKKERKLNDGDQFTDCNFWKKFAYPQLPYSQAFIEVVTDDGSVYQDGVQGSFWRTYNITAAGASVYATNVADVLTDLGVPAVSAQVTVSGHFVDARINGDSNSIVRIAASTSQVLDGQITKLEFDNSTSGATTATIEVLYKVNSVCNS